MKRTSRLIVIALVGCTWALGQAGPAIIEPNYNLAGSHFEVAPGQLITLTLQLDPTSDVYQATAPAGGDLPASLGGVTGGYSQQLGGVPPPAAILEVLPYAACPVQPPLSADVCPTLAAITIQIPFEAVCDLCSTTGGVSPGIMSFSAGQTRGPLTYVFTLSDQVHILTACDAFLNPGLGTGITTGLPCASVVAHSDGSAVSAASPARSGEEVVAYAVGLGQTNPPLATGKLVTAPAPAQETFLLDFNYHPNALPSKPLPGSPKPIYAGATPGYVGLYQINFTVPAVPAGTPPCVTTTGLLPGYNVVESNLTVSVGGQYSFDGARLCVAVPGP